MADSSISGHRSSRLAPGRPGYLHRQEAVGQPSLWYSAGTAVLHMHGISSVAISITNNTLLVCISATWWKTDLEARHPSYSAYLPIRTHEHVQYLPVELHLRRWQTSSRCRSRRELAGRDLTRSPPRGPMSISQPKGPVGCDKLNCVGIWISRQRGPLLGLGCPAP